MQSHKPSSGGAGKMNHPDANEWMAYLYREVSSERRIALDAHLAQCAACREQLTQWRSSAAALDDWKLPAGPSKQAAREFLPLAKWAAAAALVLWVGFALGRMSSNQNVEITQLKNVVAGLSNRFESVAAANLEQGEGGAAREDLAGWLADYAQLQEAQRTEDLRKVESALRGLDARFDKLRVELETVALNTQSGFQQTKAGLVTLASYAIPGGDENSPAPDSNN